MGVIWSSDTHRESFADLFEEWLEEKANEGKIDQWNVVCDSRNNKVARMEEGHFVFDVYYRQHNCLNTTQLHYEIDDYDEFDLDDYTIMV